MNIHYAVIPVVLFLAGPLKAADTAQSTSQPAGKYVDVGGNLRLAPSASQQETATGSPSSEATNTATVPAAGSPAMPPSSAPVPAQSVPSTMPSSAVQPATPNSSTTPSGQSSPSISVPGQPAGSVSQLPPSPATQQPLPPPSGMLPPDETVNQMSPNQVTPMPSQKPVAPLSPQQAAPSPAQGTPPVTQPSINAVNPDVKEPTASSY